MVYDIQRAKRLQAARRADARKTLKDQNTGANKGKARDTIDRAKKIRKSLTPWGFFSLLFQANIISDWMYGLALFAAILKDILDLIEFAGFTYIIVVVATLCISIFIGFMMILGGILGGEAPKNSFSNTRAERKIIRSWLVLLGGTTAELVFGINIIPIETLTVLIVYTFALQDRKQAQEDNKEAAQAAQQYA